MAPRDARISRDSVATGPTLTILLVFISVALYNVAELNFIILATFKRRNGLYFWSFIVATWGIVPYSIGFLLKSLQVEVHSWVYVTMIVVGWCCMVTGQSVVLYSRLHIVLHNAFQLRLVLGMIITNAIICHIPTTVMVYGANSAHPEPFITPYSICEKIQVTIFFLQESIISILYIKETVELMRVRKRGAITGGRGFSNATRWLMTHLIIVNIIVVMLDITISGLEYANQYYLQTSYKALVYSIKLKLEFSILNRLVEVAQGGSSAHDSSNIRTWTDAAGIQMDAFDRERRKPSAAGPGLGHNVYVRSESGAGAYDRKHPDAAVVMTTEVTIHRGRSRSGSGPEGDLESIGDRSGMTVDMSDGDFIGQSRAASHSSERRIVETRG
ncbi:uncharacterized protein B0T15DRAFT_255549 [Chaetomium strumarium]|uniref:DUF7703 domain-containing protein n=1 Tax=Chaetomium strumarium TaxID=1170767 RepID=A0AAJ0M0W8_9PEZI|nr:hypothetical protein B0T15DRAFT_255549 [Chaetomium strumarium]